MLHAEPAGAVLGQSGLHRANFTKGAPVSSGCAPASAAYRAIMAVSPGSIVQRDTPARRGTV
jgi:hypothetical protein